MQSLFHGTVEHGKFKPEDNQGFKLSFCSHEGKRVSVSVKRYRNKRGDPQNKYYWAVVVHLIGDYLGNTPDETHDLLKGLHNSEVKTTERGEVRVPKSTAKLDTKEFSDYLDRCKKWASIELGIYIPDPNEMEF